MANNVKATMNDSERPQPHTIQVAGSRVDHAPHMSSAATRLVV